MSLGRFLLKKNPDIRVCADDEEKDLDDNPDGGDADADDNLDGGDADDKPE